MIIGSVIIYLLAVLSVVMVWRGMWGLLDEYLWPKNPRRSYLASLLIGLVMLAIILSLIPRLPS
jgi:low temperature requirement protein LtrA